MPLLKSRINMILNREIQPLNGSPSSLGLTGVVLDVLANAVREEKGVNAMKG